jgi:hypothetical protein
VINQADSLRDMLKLNDENDSLIKLQHWKTLKVVQFEDVFDLWE